MSEQSLIFCVGAAKSGTSWLQAFLREHKDCYFRNLKELHYFSELDRGGSDWYLRRQAGRLRDARAKLERHPDRDGDWLPVLISDIEEWLATFDGKTRVDAAYLDYLGFGRVEEKIIGDFTPNYGGVSKKMLRHMANLGPDVKFIYIMRDPVARLWSAFRMTLAHFGEEAMEQRIATFLQDVDGETFAGDAADYQGTLRKLLDILPRENLHIEFYENMFTQAGADRICAFLGIDPEPVPADNVVHKGKNMKLPSILKAEFAKKLQPQYSYVEDMMGGVPPEWTENMVSA